MPSSKRLEIDKKIVYERDLALEEFTEEDDVDIQPSTFEDVVEKMEKIVKYLGLSPLLTVQGAYDQAINNGQKFVVMPCKLSKGTSGFLKVRLERSHHVRLRLNREMCLSDQLNTRKIIRKLSFKVPRSVKADSQMSWILYEYDVSATAKLGFPVSLSTVKLNPATAKQASEALHSLQDISLAELVPSAFSFLLRLKKHDDDFYLFEFQRLQKLLHYSGSVSSKQWYQIYGIMNEAKEIIAKRAVFLSHGDYNMENIMMFADDLYLSNWELAGVACPSFDVAELWCEAWQYQGWRSMFLKAYLAKETDIPAFQTSFVVAVIYHSLRHLHEKSSDQVYLQTLIDALKGFHHLTNLT